jgi:hypothetical protein
LGLGAARRGTCYVGGLEVEAAADSCRVSAFSTSFPVDVPQAQRRARRGTYYVGGLEVEADPTSLLAVLGLGLGTVEVSSRARRGTCYSFFFLPFLAA